MDTPPTVMDFGQRPELGWLPVALLSVDEAYQRKIDSRASQKAIDQIVGNFKWSCFGTALVTQKDEGWLIIDGQHRVEAARRLDIKTVPCIVVHQATMAEQAAIFVATNQVRVQVNPYTLFHARLAARDPLAIEVQGLCDEARLAIPKYPVQKDRMGAGQTLALATLEKIVKGGNPAARAGVIAAGHACEGRPGAATAVVLQAAAAAAMAKPNSISAIQNWLRGRDSGELNLRYRGSAGTSELAQRIARAVDAAPKASASMVDGGRIAPPTREQLMAGR
ncbi:ParB N-terminal domain-containing protein [Paramagnetospirillum magneticum]|uniref:ParB-like N-terminal domain-containing protein n=1 Tax=Paramagnetospirillum magneticum (strain ATCC 700264 / AMB-1) TaxID=342108 RepID=Q2W6H4_PARM1|nr:ParB N-terminal domain-containing protein [Paramagnetospirillum magneticum]BAE50551.1 hypothetical protein amb1747 [Paramagnetospirillum magneticum AMB-1]